MTKPHPADRESIARAAVARAAAATRSDLGEFGETRVLKWSRKSVVVRVYRSEGPPIVAKRTSPSSADYESRVYSDVLPRLRVGHVELLAQGVSDGHGWLFLEDAGDQELAEGDPDTRLALGRLLGRLAASSDCARGTPLREYTFDYYTRILDDLQTAVGAALVSRPDKPQEVVLAGARDQLARVREAWPAIGAFLDDGVRTVCHADVRPKNARWLRRTGELVLLDWELTGWGDAAADLGCINVTGSVDPVLMGFRLGNPDERRPLTLVAGFGRLLRMLSAMTWAMEYLDTTAEERGVGYIHRYCGHIDRALESLGPELRRS